MPSFVLTKDMETGVAKIDEQHIELINRTNELMLMGPKSASNEEIEKTLNLLSNYVVKHFTEEEELQMQSNYPKYEMHKGLHSDFVKEIKKIRDKFQKSGTSTELCLEITQTIIGWLVKHIKSVDVEFGRYYKENTK